jgi:hypothetical protein
MLNRKPCHRLSERPVALYLKEVCPTPQDDVRNRPIVAYSPLFGVKMGETGPESNSSIGCGAIGFQGCFVLCGSKASRVASSSKMESAIKAARLMRSTRHLLRSLLAYSDTRTSACARMNCSRSLRQEVVAKPQSGKTITNVRRACTKFSEYLYVQIILLQTLVFFCRQSKKKLDFFFWKSCKVVLPLSQFGCKSSERTTICSFPANITLGCFFKIVFIWFFGVIQGAAVNGGTPVFFVFRQPTSNVDCVLTLP